MPVTLPQFRTLSKWAQDGTRLVLVRGTDKPTTLWAGLGNRSGLHSYADTVTREKWAKSGPGLRKKLVKLIDGDVVEIQDFRNKTRDRGNWITFGHVTVAAEGKAPMCYHLNMGTYDSGCPDCDHEFDDIGE